MYGREPARQGNGQSTESGVYSPFSKGSTVTPSRFVRGLCLIITGHEFIKYRKKIIIGAKSAFMINKLKSKRWRSSLLKRLEMKVIDILDKIAQFVKR